MPENNEEAVPREIIALARELLPVIRLIRNQGHGEGSILIRMVGGQIHMADFTGRWFFGSKPSVRRRSSDNGDASI